MTEANKKNTKNTVDDKYKSAARDVVDEALAAHNLAPGVQKALDKAISDSNAIKKSKLDYKQPGFWVPIGVTILGMIVSAIVAILK